MGKTSNKVPSFEFVVGNRPDQLNGGTSRKVRSHVSTLAWQTHGSRMGRPAGSKGARLDTTTKTKTKTKTLSDRQKPAKSAYISKDSRRLRKIHQKKSQWRITFECITEWSDRDRADEHNGRTMSSSPIETDDIFPSDGGMFIERQLGGGRVDPFRSCPGSWKPFMPFLVDHYIVHMAVDIPELDQDSHKGLLRTRWFPLVLSELAAFQAVLLLAACNYVSVNGVSGLRCDLLQLKANAINSINEALQDSDKMLSDGLIGAVAKMASFEAMHGDMESFCLHMQGLKNMVELRGGMDSLGLDGLLRRIIVWIDLNSSFLLQTPRFFPGHYFTHEVLSEPNPERFVAV